MYVNVKSMKIYVIEDYLKKFKDVNNCLISKLYLLIEQIITN